MKSRDASFSENYKTLFADWEIAIAVRLVSRFRTEQRVLEREDFEDLLQECLMHWFSNRDKYDPSRHANQRTFMAKVVTNKLKDLAKARKAATRRAAYEALSIDAPIKEDEPSRTYVDLIDDVTKEVDPEEAIFLIPFKVRLAKAWSQLSEEERRLCQLRMDGLNMEEAYETMGIGKDEAYKMRERIQEVFENEDLRGYFK
jgi:RNA polymerase sigma factor (sigma-70 family)